MSQPILRTTTTRIGPSIDGLTFKFGVETNGGRDVGSVWKGEGGWVAVHAPKGADAQSSDAHSRRIDAVAWLREAHVAAHARSAADPSRSVLATLLTRNGMPASRLVEMLRACVSSGAGMFIEIDDDAGMPAVLPFHPVSDIFYLSSFGDQGIRDRRYLTDDPSLADDLAARFAGDVVRCEDVARSIAGEPAEAFRP